MGTVKADKYFDLNALPYPMESNSAEEILMDNVLEHLGDIPKIMEELHRILCPQGVLKIFVPYGKTDWALQDPTHTHFFTERSLDYFVEGHPFSFYSNARFQLVKAELRGDAFTLRHRVRNLLPFKSILKYFFWNIYDAVYFELRKP